MAKTSKANNEDEVYDAMLKYCIKKGFKFREAQLRYMSEQCYLFYEAKGWAGSKYWPALAMKWVLTQVGGKSMEVSKKARGKSVKDTIMEQENE